ncbi:MAG: hypothetical protein ACFHHU_00765 [Porticoccaceae bacterium]
MATNVISPKPIDNRKELRVKLDPDLVEALNATQMLFESHGFVLHTEEEITARVRSYLAKVLKTAPTLEDFRPPHHKSSNAFFNHWVLNRPSKVGHIHEDKEGRYQRPSSFMLLHALQYVRYKHSNPDKLE